MVEGVNVFPEGLRGMPARTDASKRLKKGAFTVTASEAAAANAQARGQATAFDMAHPALVRTFALDAGTTCNECRLEAVFVGLEAPVQDNPPYGLG